MHTRTLLTRMCSYGAAMVGVATAKSPCGPYTYKSSFKPLGAESRDEGVFQDGMIFKTLPMSPGGTDTTWLIHKLTDDCTSAYLLPGFTDTCESLTVPPAAQTTYLLYASDNNQNFKISRMDANYYNVTSQVSVMNGASLMSERSAIKA